jgi:LAS superfamily LD-carboxypeptidase LdcB
MNRKRFIKALALAGIGIQLPYSSQILKALTVDDIEIKHLLGLSQSHLKSKSILLEESTYEAFSTMKSAALKDQIDLQIVSGYRSFERQKLIWERKFKRLSKTKKPTKVISEIITYSSIPGTSRHHWGTDIDIIDGAVQPPTGGLLLESNYHGKAAFSKMKSWMDLYSKDFGFELVYTQNEKRTGFNYEPWHYSYAPVSKAYLKLQTGRSYKTAWYDLEFEGKSDMSQAFVDSYFKNYGMGINPSLMPS